MFTFTTVAICLQSIYFTNGHNCPNKCPATESDMACGFDVKEVQYKMFLSLCALNNYKECYQVELAETPLKYCVNEHNSVSRKVYGESCPVFCANYYRPVCGANRMKSYVYRTFNNGCYLDMINCRGDDDSGYVEVPLMYCPNHLMKNIFKEQVVVHSYNDFNENF